MNVTVVRDDGVVWVDGVFRSVDLSTLPVGVRIMQWSGDSGHVEYDDQANTVIDTIGAIQAFIDLWAAAAPVVIPPTSAELIAAAQARIMDAYSSEINALTAQYPLDEISSWPKQEAEARAWLLDPEADIPWLKGMSTARGINIANLVVSIIRNADALAPLYGAATGKRQRLRDQIDALGPDATEEELDVIQW